MSRHTKPLAPKHPRIVAPSASFLAAVGAESPLVRFGPATLSMLAAVAPSSALPQLSKPVSLPQPVARGGRTFPAASPPPTPTNSTTAARVSPAPPAPPAPPFQPPSAAAFGIAATLTLISMRSSAVAALTTLAAELAHPKFNPASRLEALGHITRLPFMRLAPQGNHRSDPVFDAGYTHYAAAVQSFNQQLMGAKYSAGHTLMEISKPPAAGVSEKAEAASPDPAPSASSPETDRKSITLRIKALVTTCRIPITRFGPQDFGAADPSLATKLIGQPYPSPVSSAAPNPAPTPASAQTSHPTPPSSTLASQPFHTSIPSPASPVASAPAAFSVTSAVSLSRSSSDASISCPSSNASPAAAA